MKRNIFKYIAIVVLVIALVVISVIKSRVSASRHEEDIRRIKEEYFATRNGEYLKLLDDSTRFYVDSIVKLEGYYGLIIDSLNKYHDSLQLGLISAETEKDNNQEMVNKPEPEPEIDPIIQKVLSSYQNQLGDLPKDLTKYENRISLYEIKINLSREFNISPDSVWTIINSSG